MRLRTFRKQHLQFRLCPELATVLCHTHLFHTSNTTMSAVATRSEYCYCCHYVVTAVTVVADPPFKVTPLPACGSTTGATTAGHTTFTSAPHTPAAIRGSFQMPFDLLLRPNCGYNCCLRRRCFILRWGGGDIGDTAGFRHQVRLTRYTAAA